MRSATRKNSSYSLSPEGKALLEKLAEHHGITRTGFLEMAIREGARRARLIPFDRPPRSSPKAADAAAAFGGAA
jgi:hypothetical protein